MPPAPLRPNRRRRRRIRYNLILAASAVATAAGIDAIRPEGATFGIRWSLALGYAGFLLLSLTLVIGAWRVARGGTYPVSTTLRRDVGIWAAGLAVAHVVFGIQNHFVGRLWQYFVWPTAAGARVPVRYDWFGIANYAGLFATLLLVLLLAISNDASIRRLGSVRWKGLQRLNYVGYSLVLFHAALFIQGSDRPLRLVLLFSVATVAVLALQAWGVARFRRTRERRR